MNHVLQCCALTPVHIFFHLYPFVSTRALCTAATTVTGISANKSLFALDVRDAIATPPQELTYSIWDMSLGIRSSASSGRRRERSSTACRQRARYAIISVRESMYDGKTPFVLLNPGMNAKVHRWTFQYLFSLGTRALRHPLWPMPFSAGRASVLDHRPESYNEQFMLLLLCRRRTHSPRTRSSA